MRSSSDARILPSIRPFRFAITAHRARSGADWRAKARRIEALGYDTLLITDHLTAQFATVPALMAALDATTTLRVGSFVFANDYRNPVMLAKEIATLDVLSDGRIDFGLGAGWKTRDYAMLGIPYDPPGVRVSRFIEAVRLIDRLLTEEEVDFTGTYYRVRGASILPRPVQRPRPPFMIGGGGPRVLGFAARHADIVAFIPKMSSRGRPNVREGTMGGTARRIARVREVAKDRLDRIDLNVVAFDAGVIGRSRSFAEGASTLLKAGGTALVDTPHALYGTPDSIRRKLIERRERYGINYYALPEQAMEALAPIVAELRGT